MKMLMISWIALCLSPLIYADIYMHVPRGSNNRLNERSATRRNANRAFDSQNNNRGGYNVGDNTTKAATKVEEQYRMSFVTSHENTDTTKPIKDQSGASFLPIEWTNQHGCGGNEDDAPNKVNCNIVFQVMCQPFDPTKPVTQDDMRDGLETNTNDYKPPGNNEKFSDFANRKNSHNKIRRVLQEPYEWYDKCHTRQRNEGLFTADQKLKGDTSKYTRQNPNGNRRGYECPEERDYYPYWHPTDWKDIFVLAENQSRCNSYQSESFNVKPRHECIEKWNADNPTQPPKHYSKHNNEKNCTDAGGQWLEFHNYLEILEGVSKTKCGQLNTSATTFSTKGRLIWGRPMYRRNEACLVKLDPPLCKEAPFSRVNHNGNGVDLEPLTLYWTIPHFPSKRSHRCNLRIRYNISTDDYDPFRTDSAQNGKEKSPVTQNPLVDIGAGSIALRLAVNTAQFGRTFQDRSHLFELYDRTKVIPASYQDRTIHSVHVRGKRGNIVQVYPAVEYDFVPTNLVMKHDELVHFQWTGSNSHNNGNPAGDGQAGDDGEGNRGTDRNNVGGLGDRVTNFLLPANHPNNLCQSIKTIVWSAYGEKTFPKDATADNKIRLDACIQMLSSGYYECLLDSNNYCKGKSLASKKETMDPLLNNADASFRGILLEIKPGSYNYTCSRNNNFSNRSQKASLLVLPP